MDAISQKLSSLPKTDGRHLTVFQNLAINLPISDIKHSEFIIREFAKFVVPKKEKNKYLEYANYLIKQCNIPLYLISEIFSKYHSPNYKDYLRVFSKDGLCVYLYFFVKHNTKCTSNFIRTTITDKIKYLPIKLQDPQLLNKLSPIFEAVEKMNYIEKPMTKNILTQFTSDGTSLNIYYSIPSHVIVSNISLSQLYTIICILLLINSDKYFYIIKNLFRFLVEHTTMFNFVDFFKFLIEFDLYEMIQMHCDEEMGMRVHNVYYCFGPISRRGQIPDEELSRILYIASYRSRTIYYGMRLQSNANSQIIQPDIRKVGITMFSISLVICANTNLLNVLSDIVAEYVQFNGSRDQQII